MSNKNPSPVSGSQTPLKKGPDWVTWSIVGGLLIAVLALFVKAWSVIPESLPDPGEHARMMVVPREIPDFVLRDHRGEAFSQDQLKGQWSLLFFGYTSCPDVCPFVLQELALVKKAFEERTDSEREMPEVVFVSVDPDRDSQIRLSEYMNFFDSDFVGVSGPDEELQILASGVGAYYRVPDVAEGQGYLVDHASKIFLVDPNGRFLALLDDPHDPEEFIELLAKVQTIGETHL